MTEKMEKAMDDPGRALDRMGVVVEGSDGARLMLALDFKELMDAVIPRNKYYIIGRIAGMIEALWKSEYVTEQADAAMAALHRVREMVMKEEELIN